MAAVTDTPATKRSKRAKGQTTKGAADPSEEQDLAPERASRSRADSTTDESRPGGAERAGSAPPLDRGPLRRYIRRPLWWLPVALFAGALLYATELQDVWNDERTYGRGDPLPAVVDEDYEGGDEIPVTYEHPLFGPAEATVSLSRWHTGPRPEAGDVIAVRAHRANPFTVRLPSSDPDRPPLWMALLPMVPFLGAGGRRWWTARRAQRVLDRPAAAGADELLGRLRPRRRRDQTVLLDLFPIDADAERRPLCSVPLVSSLGLPVGGTPFPVEVHGRPRRFARVVARVPDGVLWPRRRALVLPRWLTAAERGPAAVPTRRGDEIGVTPSPLEPRRLRPPKQVWPSPSGRLLLAAGLLAAGLAIGVVGTLNIVQQADEAQSVPKGMVEVAAQVIGGRDDGLAEVAYRLPGESEGEPQQSLVALPNAAAWPPGMPLLLVVDPDAPTYAQLPPSPYRAAEPAVWVWLPALAAGLGMARTVRWKRAVERAAQDERWYVVYVDRVDDITLRIARPDASTASCLVTLPRSNDSPPPALARTLSRERPVYAYSAPAPGHKLILRFGGAVVAATSAAAVRDRPWRRRWRVFSQWLKRKSNRPDFNP